MGVLLNFNVCVVKIGMVCVVRYEWCAPLKSEWYVLLDTNVCVVKIGMVCIVRYEWCTPLKFEWACC